MSFFKRLLGLDFLDEIVTPARRRPDASSAPPPVGYRVYTTEFDEVVRPQDLLLTFALQSANKRYEFEKLQKQFLNGFAFERLALVEKSARLIRGIVSRYSQEERGKIVVSVLIDHSGSMRGNRIVSACIAAEAIVSVFQQCGIRSEVIGFTTISWKGGRSREKWRSHGRPANPGRLCDLRHILYLEAGQSAHTYPKFSEALYPDLLKENIDGEALEFAVARLPVEEWDRRVIVVISDGAPVDDSTLQVNKDQAILINHLKEVEERIRSEGVAIGHVLLTEMAYRPDLRTFEYGYDPLTTGEALIKVLWQLLDIHFEVPQQPDATST